MNVALCLIVAGSKQTSIIGLQSISRLLTPVLRRENLRGRQVMNKALYSLLHLDGVSCKRAFHRSNEDCLPLKQMYLTKHFGIV